MNLFCHSKANLRFGEIDNVNLSSHLSSQAIFLCLATRNDIFDINRIYGICYCVTCAGVPAVISGNDIMSLKIMQEMDVEILRNNEFSSGDKIRIIDGPLCGYEGILIEIKGKKKFGVSISCVNLTAVVDLNTSKMEKCDISNNFREVIIFK